MQRLAHSSILITVLLLGYGLSTSTHASSLAKLFAPTSEVWERWQTHDATNPAEIDHSAWQMILSAYTKPSSDGMIRFAYTAVSAEDRKTLSDYVSGLSDHKISRYRPTEQFAYWVNLYNALTIQVVLQHYPVDSIRDIDISPGLFSDGPWKKKLLTIEGEQVSLDDIEHRILRPIWKDPRIHYSVNCASIGCPDLQPEAFTAANTERLLEKAARDYINHQRGVKVKDARVIVSSIYNWFESDFAEDGGVLAHIHRYASETLQDELNGIKEIADYEYDWSLNGAE